MKSFGVCAIATILACLSGSRGLRASESAPGGEILEVFQAEAGFVSSEKQKPIVATYGCGPSVAVGGYDSVNHAAFIAHVQTAKEAREGCGTLLRNIAGLIMQQPVSKETPIKIYMRGSGWFNSQETIGVLKQCLQSGSDIPTEFVPADSHRSSLQIDSRSGEVSEYSPLNNPHRRALTDQDLVRMRWSIVYPKLEILYSDIYSPAH